MLITLEAPLGSASAVWIVRCVAIAPLDRVALIALEVIDFARLNLNTQ
jgi:hypothetical protein